MKCCDIKIGDLRHKIQIALVALVDDNQGGQTQQKTTVERWAKIKNISGSEAKWAGHLDAKHMSRFIIHYSPDFLESDEIVYNGYTYNIRYIDNIEEMNEWLAIDAVRGVAL